MDLPLMLTSHNINLYSRQAFLKKYHIILCALVTSALTLTTTYFILNYTHELRVKSSLIKKTILDHLNKKNSITLPSNTNAIIKYHNNVLLNQQQQHKIISTINKIEHTIPKLVTLNKIYFNHTIWTIDANSPINSLITTFAQTLSATITDIQENTHARHYQFKLTLKT